jgi:hypothetical protein
MSALIKGRNTRHKGACTISKYLLKLISDPLKVLGNFSNLSGIPLARKLASYAAMNLKMSPSPPRFAKTARPNGRLNLSLR